MEGEIEGDSCMGTGRIIVSFFLFAFALMVKAQTLTDSNLPIVVIETDGGVNIPDEPKVLGTMKIIWHQDGSRNYMTDIALSGSSLRSIYAQALQQIREFGFG